MENKQPKEMSAEELEQVSGGQMPREYYNTTSSEVIRRDSKGNPTHWRDKSRGVYLTEPYYFVCPNCGRLLHEGTLGRLYCDPCDESWFQFSVRDGYRRFGFYSGR